MTNRDSPQDATIIVVERLFGRIGQGRLAKQLYEALVGVALETQRTGNPGVVTVRFKVSAPAGSPAVQITGTVSRVMPTGSPEGATVFVAPGVGGLHSSDPQQYAMAGIREIIIGAQVVDRATSEFGGAQR